MSPCAGCEDRWVATAVVGRVANTLIAYLSVAAKRALAQVDKTADFSDPNNAFAAALIANDDMSEPLLWTARRMWSDETFQKEIAPTLSRPPGPIADDEAKKFWRRAGARLDRETARKRRKAERMRLVRERARASAEALTFPVVQTIAELVGNFGLARDTGQLMLEPGAERRDERFTLLLAHAATLIGAPAPNRLLDRIELGDPLERLAGDRRDALGLIEESSSQMRPAEGERDPARSLGGDRLGFGAVSQRL
jgi:hypothetical protein